MPGLATTVAYNLCSILDFGSYGAKQEINDLLSLIFESQLCSSEELQQGSQIGLSNFSSSIGVRSGSRIHNQSAPGKLPSNVHIAKTLQLNCYCIAF
jgi:hypothetical protein